MQRCAVALARSGRSLRSVSRGLPQLGSAAALEISEWHQVGRTPDQLTECHDLALKSLLAAEDCLLGLGVQEDWNQCAVALATLARTTLEASGQALFLLEEDLAALERVRRFMRLTDESVDRSNGILSLLHLPPETPAAEKLRGIADLVLAFSGAEGGLGPKPTHEQRVVTILDRLEVPGGGPRVTYALISGIAHADKVGLDNVVPGRFPDAENRGASQLTVERALAWFIWAAAGGYAISFDRAVSHFGWSTDVWSMAVAHWMNGIQAQFMDVAAEVRAELAGRTGPPLPGASHLPPEVGPER